ncbi:MAG: hypothetical protein WCY07_14415 [Pigmentiphaga sp.]
MKIIHPNAINATNAAATIVTMPMDSPCEKPALLIVDLMAVRAEACSADGG